MQRAILAHLHQRPSGDVVVAYHEPQVRLAEGFHDARAVAKEMTRGDQFSDPRRQASFSRALGALVRRGEVQAHSLVPLAEWWPDRRWSSRVERLSDGDYLNVPSGTRWRRRFLSVRQLS